MRASQPTYKRLTEENFVKFFEELSINKPEREFVVQGGLGFKKLVDKKIQQKVYKNMVELYLNISLLTQEQSDNLVAMILSEDEENFEVAKSIIDNIKENGHILSSK